MSFLSGLDCAAVLRRARLRGARFLGAPAVPVLAALLALGAVGLTGCDDDGDTTSVDAGPDALGPACKMVDCAKLPMPQHQCMNGGKASYVCARNVGGACVWDQPVCAPDVNSDGGAEVGDAPNSEVGDGAPDDDALDAPLSEVGG